MSGGRVCLEIRHQTLEIPPPVFFWRTGPHIPCNVEFSKEYAAALKGKAVYLCMKILPALWPIGT